MGIPLTERVFGICIDCQSCLTGGRCRFIVRGATFKLASALMSQANSSEYWQGYYQANRDLLLEKHKKWNRENTPKVKATSSFNSFLKYNKIPRPTNCQECGEKTRYIVAHHQNSEDAFSIHWLCVSCHNRVHNGNLKLKSKPVKY